MALKEIEATCRACGTEFRAVPKRTFLGFQRLVCPGCSSPVIYPLTRGYRITYWVFVALMAWTVLDAIAHGGIAVPGLLGLAVIIGLMRDHRIRKEVAAALGKSRA